MSEYDCNELREITSTRQKKKKKNESAEADACMSLSIHSHAHAASAACSYLSQPDRLNTERPQLCLLVRRKKHASVSSELAGKVSIGHVRIGREPHALSMAIFFV